jgi:hypothetical protein
MLNASLRRSVTLAALAILPAAARAEWIDYAQADISSSATTIVLVGTVGTGDDAKPAPTVSASYTRWSTGEAGGAGIVYRWALPLETQHWLLGAGAGVNANRSWAPADDEHDSALALWLQSEWFGPAPGGSYYALARASSYRETWLATAQYAPTGLPVSAEWTRYHERGYQATNIGVRVATGLARWFVRLGVTRGNGETSPYVGVVYNGF